MVFTYHAEVERKNRMAMLEETLGFTNPVLEVVIQERRYFLTSSGIIIVKPMTRDIVITAFMATYDQGYRLYQLAGKKEVSPKMRKRLLKNEKRHSELFSIYD